MNLLDRIIFKVKKIIHILLKKINLKILKYEDYENLTKSQVSIFDIKFLSALVNSGKINDVIKYLEKSKSDLRQDLFALNELNFKKNGFLSSLVLVMELFHRIPICSKKTSNGTAYFVNQLDFLVSSYK